jgi:tellurite methyltransferase
MANPPAEGDVAGQSGSGLKKAADFAADLDWPGYFRVVVGKPPRDTLVLALDFFDRDDPSGSEASKGRRKTRFAIDLGCGEGRDTLELLRRGWRVLAMDSHPEAFEHLRPRVRGEARERLQMLSVPFGQMFLPAADLVNASYSLPFCEPEVFAALWERIVDAVRPGGRFAGQFFGDRDDWVKRGDRIHHTRAEVEECLRSFDIEYFDEVEKDEVMADGAVKHWHVFHVVGRKR